MTMNNDDKGVAERVVSGEATFFWEQDGNQSSAEPER